MKFLKIWDQLSSNGVKSEMSFTEVKRIRIINQFCIVGIYIAISYTVFLFCFSARLLALLDFAIAVSGIITYILIKKTNYKIAAVFMFVTIPITLLFLNVFWGNVGAELYFFSMFILAYYIFTERKFLFPIIIYMILVFILAKYYSAIEKPTGIVLVLTPYFYYVNIGCTFIIAALFLKLFTDEHINYQHQVETKNKLLEKAVNKTLQKNEQIQTLLKELSHRTKNNLQLVSSLINLQSSKITDDVAKKAMEESRNRIISISLVYEKLYQNNQVTTVSFKEYTNDLISYLSDTFNDKNNPVQIEQDIDDFTINVDSAVTLGLLINELLTNSFKHGLKDSQVKFLKISIKKDNENKIDICVSDSGKGIEKIMELNNDTSFGTKLIHSLAKQMDGKISVNSNKENHISIRLLLVE